MSIGPCTQQQVQQIYAIPPYILTTSGSVAAFIATGNALINNWAPQIGQQDNILEIMQVNLVAHLMQSFEPQTGTYSGMKIIDKNYGEFLMSTEYGQRILMMDTQGYLRSYGRKRARAWSVGLPPCNGG